MALDFITKLFRGRAPQDDASLLQLATPTTIGPDRPLTRILVGGITIVGIAVAGTIALSAMGVMLAAMLALYFLLTQVLGLELELDPRAFVEEAQRYAAQSRAN